MSNEFVAHHEVVSALTEGRPLLDVRAPVEFLAGSLPSAVNIPIMNDEERRLIGIEYKQKGPAAAIALGESMISGEKKESRIKSWKDFFDQNPSSFLFCFRGGQRSAYAQKWLNEAGLKIGRIEGGYKRYRQFLIESTHQIAESSDFLVITGKTGSGKTEMLRQLSTTHRLVDLEKLANHRGSAFGSYVSHQPTQINFENELGSALLAQSKLKRPLLLEDESRTIGSIVLPESLYVKMRTAPLVTIEDPIEVRMERIFKEYVAIPLAKEKHNFQGRQAVLDRLQASLLKIQKRLGGQRYSEASSLLQQAFMSPHYLNLESHMAWIEFLLVNYYDPLYQRGLNLKKDRIVYSDTWDGVISYLNDSAI